MAEDLWVAHIFSEILVHGSEIVAGNHSDHLTLRSAI
jgi:hypothetical protein